MSTTSNDVEQELLQVNLKRIELAEEKQQLEIKLDEAKKQEADFATERKQWWDKNEVLNNWIEYLKWIFIRLDQLIITLYNPSMIEFMTCEQVSLKSMCS